LDVSPSDLKRLLARIGSDQFNPSANGFRTGDAQPHTDAVCPMLGFADDRQRHYSRPTALHRCFAAGTPSLVTTQEQRALCITDRFPPCPPFRTAQHPPAPAKPVEPPPPEARDQQPAAPAPLPPPARPAYGQVPPGVAARMAAATQLHLEPTAP